MLNHLKSFQIKCKECEFIHITVRLIYRDILYVFHFQYSTELIRMKGF